MNEDETFVLPLLPEKTVKANMNSITNTIITKRKQGLELFLNKIFTHAKVRSSKAFRKFITEVKNLINKSSIQKSKKLTSMIFTNLRNIFVSGRELSFNK